MGRCKLIPSTSLVSLSSSNKGECAREAQAYPNVTSDVTVYTPHVPMYLATHRLYSAVPAKSAAWYAVIDCTTSYCGVELLLWC